MAALLPRGYRSASEYRIKEEEKNAIIRTVSYHRKGFDTAVIWFPPHKYVSVRPSIVKPFPRTSCVGLGILNRLPPELLHDVLFRLDMQSLFKFRQVNLRSRQTVDSLKQYRMVVSHGLNLFCALLRTKLANDTSVLDFYDVLCTKACSLCGEFGGFVSLLTWTRCCFPCIYEDPKIRVRRLDWVQEELGLNRAESEQLRSFKTLPGTYALFDSSFDFAYVVVSDQQAHSIAPPAFCTGPATHIQPSPLFGCLGSCALPYYDKQTGSIEHGVSCAGCELPAGRVWAPLAREKVYSRDGFLEHFKWCQQAQELWRSSHGGK